MAHTSSLMVLGALLATQITTVDAAYECSSTDRKTLKTTASSITCLIGEGTPHCSSSDCCDQTGCGAAGLSCPAGQYADETIAGTDAPTCCKAKALCTAFTCPAGYKKKTDTTLTCGKKTCTDIDAFRCCDADDTKCRSYTCTASATKERDDTKYDTMGRTDALCCKDRPLCSDSRVTAYCAGRGELVDATKSTEVAGSNCCKADATKCSSMTGSCASGKYYVASATGTSNGTAACCPTLPTCQTYVAPTPAAVATASSAVRYACAHQTFAMLFFVLVSAANQL